MKKIIIVLLFSIFVCKIQGQDTLYATIGFDPNEITIQTNSGIDSLGLHALYVYTSNIEERKIKYVTIFETNTSGQKLKGLSKLCRDCKVEITSNDYEAFYAIKARNPNNQHLFQNLDKFGFYIPVEKHIFVNKGMKVSKKYFVKIKYRGKRNFAYFEINLYGKFSTDENFADVKIDWAYTY